MPKAIGIRRELEGIQGFGPSSPGKRSKSSFNRVAWADSIARGEIAAFCPGPVWPWTPERITTDSSSPTATSLRAGFTQDLAAPPESSPFSR